MKLSRRQFAFSALPAAAVAGGVGYLAWPGASMYPVGRSRARPIVSDPVLPARADVVVIGGGDSGVCAALCLAERGLSVALCEKGVIAGEASGRSLGWVESLYQPTTTSALVLRAKTLWPSMDARIGQDSSYRRTGLSMLCPNEQAMTAAQAWIDAVKGEPGYDPTLLNRAQSAQLVNSPADSWAGALYQPSDGTAEPRLFAPAVAEGARKHGVSIHQQCAVRGLETSGGRVCAVITEHGPIRTDKVILAGGYWSAAFFENMNLALPQLPTFTSLISIAPIPGGPKVSSMHGTVGWRVEADGGYSLGRPTGLASIERDSFRYGWRFVSALRRMWPTVRPAVGTDLFRSLAVLRHWRLDQRSPFEDARILEPRIWHGTLDSAWDELRATMPAFAHARKRAEWAGVVVNFPDDVPVLAPVTAVPGLVVCAGLDFGLSAAPAVGELLADLVTGTTPQVDVKPFRYERLIDGSSLTPPPLTPQGL